MRNFCSIACAILVGEHRDMVAAATELSCLHRECPNKMSLKIRTSARSSLPSAPQETVRSRFDIGSKLQADLLEMLLGVLMPEGVGDPSGPLEAIAHLMPLQR
jgi:hypothetical protein